MKYENWEEGYEFFIFSKMIFIDYEKKIRKTLILIFFCKPQ